MPRPTSTRKASISDEKAPKRYTSKRTTPTAPITGEDEKAHQTPKRQTSKRTSPAPIIAPEPILARDAPSHAVPPQQPAQRPGLHRRRTTARTRYIDMLLGLDTVSPLHNILASLFVWILLAGYIVFPATFTSLQKTAYDAKANTALKAEALRTARNLPLLYVAAVACGVGIVGCLWLWWMHRGNYVWVINRIFLPALLNSVAGLVSTLVNVYSAQNGQYSVTAKVTVVVTAACSVVAAALFLLYNTVMLKLVKRKHEREIKAAERGEERGDGDV